MVRRMKSREIAWILRVRVPVRFHQVDEGCYRTTYAERTRADSDGLVVLSDLFLCAVYIVRSAVRFVSPSIADF
jgi:hypothetical protein